MGTVLALTSIEADQRKMELARALPGLGEQRGRLARIGRGGDFANVFTAAFSLRRMRDVSLIHACGLAAFGAAAVGCSCPIVFSPTTGPGIAGAARWARWAQRRRRVEVICQTDSQRLAMIGGGVDPLRCDVIVPGFTLPQAIVEPDPQQRATLGLNAQDFVLLAIGAARRPPGYDLVVWAGSILHVLDPHVRVLSVAGSTQLERAKRLARRLNQPQLVAAPGTASGLGLNLEKLLSAADCAVVNAKGDLDLHALAITMASGVPIVATESPQTRQFLKDDVNARVVPAGQPRLLAQAILRLRENEASGRRLGEQARREALARFSRERFFQEYRLLYQRLLAR